MLENGPRATVYEARNLAKVYEMGEVTVHALRGIDVSFYESELVVLLGHSGSGKSTLLNILGGLDVPTSGEVFYRSRKMSDFSEAELTRYRREHVGFVFQFYNLIPSLTARENVGLVTEIARNPMKPEDALAGEQQRVAIARAIAKQPDVLLCDEPTGALDLETGILVLEAIDRVNRDLGTTTVVITHNRVISEMAQRVIRLSDGRIESVTSNATVRPARELNW